MFTFFDLFLFFIEIVGVVEISVRGFVNSIYCHLKSDVSLFKHVSFDKLKTLKY